MIVLCCVLWLCCPVRRNKVIYSIAFQRPVFWIWWAHSARIIAFIHNTATDAVPCNFTTSLSSVQHSAVQPPLHTPLVPCIPLLAAFYNGETCGGVPVYGTSCVFMSSGGHPCANSFGLDYGNSVLPGLPVYLVRRLESVLNAAARLTYHLRRLRRAGLPSTGCASLRESSSGSPCWHIKSSTDLHRGTSALSHVSPTYPVALAVFCRHQSPGSAYQQT